MTDRDLAAADLKLLREGEWMNGFTEPIARLLADCEEKCFVLNGLMPSLKDTREALLRDIFGSTGERFTVHSPFHCDFGFNIHVGNNFVANFNLTILDEAEVRIGNNVFIGPNTTICTIVHSLDSRKRNEGIMRALPVTIGNDVWIASNVVVLPGVKIGDRAVIGAGSVVTRDVDADTVVAGNPARVIRSMR